MKTLGIIFLVICIPAGLFVSLYLCLVGGIIQLIEGIQTNPVSASSIAWGIVRICFSGVAGFATFLICSLIGIIFLGVSK